MPIVVLGLAVAPCSSALVSNVALLSCCAAPASAESPFPHFAADRPIASAIAISVPEVSPRVQIAVGSFQGLTT